jgi:thiol-disulfide isomerase/thioredoxin
MKNLLSFVTFLICLILPNCAQKEIKEKQFILNGKISDQDSGFIILQYGILSAFHSDTSIIKNGNFQFKGFLKEPTRAVIKNNKLNQIDIYLEPEKMNINISKINFKDFTLTGSKSNQELSGLNKTLKSDSNRDSILEKFVISNPKSYITPYYLYDLGYRNKVSLDSLKLIFYSLDTKVQSSQYGRITKGFIRGKDNTTAGNYATDFNTLDINNNPISLYQFRNKNVVILDFWASWCVPCRESIPHLKKLYNKFHSQGLEIISVASMDTNREKWQTAIKEDSIFMWYHVANYFQTGEIINEDLTFDYPLGPIPRTILIDKDGRVLGNWVGYTKENEIDLDKQLDLLFTNK